MTRLYRQRRSRLLEALYEHFGAEVRISGEAAGLHVLVTLTGASGIPEERIAEVAAGRGVRRLPRPGAGVRSRPEDLMVTAGFGQGLALICRVLLDRGHTRLAVEDPGHPGEREFVTRS
ncbi:hypothetical protein [Streptomyces sp. WM6378]|uniref:hypothetical protein n=1 Tax=Streptomyces sp. WM6378 TaxID=1415557 RepID=UPI0006AEE0E0|nr:hypothetical protein [Streptomyces sp. WM6378]KOU39390.1 hypothetical protein ADK54_26000 [Streptomyces sp. WM6378]